MDDRGKKSKKVTNRSRSKGRRTSPETEDTMGKPRQDASPSGSRDVSGKELTGAKRKQPKRERWLLTRKTWRYMADAGRRLIPEGAHNRAEDVPKIEAYFQEVCHREPRFLLWRKSSYPGALAFRAHRKRQRKKGGSYREKASSADEADELRAAALGAKGVVGVSGSTPSGSMQMTPSSSGRFDLQRLRQEFLQGAGHNARPPSPTSVSRPMLVNKQTPETQQDEEAERRWFIDTLCRYLNREEAAEAGFVSQERDTTDYQMLVEQLRKHMSSLSLCSESEDGGSVAGSSSSLHKAAGSVTGTTGPTSRWAGARPPPPSGAVSFTGDFQQQKLLDTFQRFYSKSTNRQKVISDLLTDRKLLEKLYFDLRQTRGFGGRRDGSGFDRDTAGLDFQLRRREMASVGAAGAARIRSTAEAADEAGFPGAGRGRQRRRGDPTFAFSSPPPLIEVQDEGDGSCDVACQTPPVCAETLNALEEHLRREKERQEEEGGGSGGASPRGGTNRRRSSVDHDDVSPSVSDTIKRYLRMARKKSMDGDKADRFKRVNYDRNLRNIKAKGETTKPGDDDGLNKGAQTDLAWVDAMRELKVASVADADVESEVVVGTGTETPRGGQSSRCSSVEGEASTPSTPHASRGLFASGQNFLAGLLHGLQHAAGTGADAAGGGGGVSAGAAVPKSKSTSSMVQQGSRLVAKKLWKRSTSTGRSAAAAQPIACTWTSQGRCTWSNHEGRTVTLSDTPLLHLSELERLVLVKVAVAKLQALNLGVTVRVPSESVAGPSVQKPKRRRPYLLKGGRRALTTGIFDTGRSRDSDKDKGSEGGLVFGIPLAQCLENDRIAVRAGSGSVDAGSVGSVGGVAGAGSGGIGTDAATGTVVAGLRRQSHHGSRASFSSLIEMATSQRPEGSGSCESLAAAGSGGGGGGSGTALPRAAGSVPGLLDSLSSCGGSTSELLSAGSVGGSGVGSDASGATVPRLVSACFRHLERYGLDTIGLFRVSTSKKRVRQLREDFDCGKDVALGEEHCPHDVATLLKEFLRDLPEPLLSRDLYHAFVQTQKIRNRRLQFEALQHLVQLLPPVNRDTLHGLLTFLSTVAAHAGDRRNADGEWVSGNKMDSNNLATVIAPNVLHCLKAGAQEVSAERAEERIDVINVVRALIDHHRSLFTVPADLLDEVYLHLMDSHPDTLDQLLRQRDAQADDFGDDLESGCSELTSPVDAEAPLPVPTPPPQGVEAAAAPPRRVWSREEFLHESAATGGPDLAMRQSKHRERSRPARKRWSEDTSAGAATAAAAAAVAGRRRATDGDTRASTESPTPPSPAATDHGVITASLKIPVPSSALTMDDVDIPFIEDGVADAGARQQMTFGPGGLVRSGSTTAAAAAAAAAAARKQRRARTASGGSDSSQASPLGTGQTDSALGSSCATYSSPQRNTPSVASGSDGPYSSPPSWASSPPTSPDAGSEDVASARLSFASKVSPVKGPGATLTSKEAAPVILQKVTFTSTSELKQVHRSGTAENVPASLAGRTTDQQQDYTTFASPSRDVRRTRASSPTTSSPSPHPAPSKPSTLALDLHESSGTALDRKLTTSISSIGGAVMRSKTADIERMLRLQKVEQQRPAPKVETVSATTESQDKKKYTKRRYTDSRHQTRLIPDAEALGDGSGSAAATSAAPMTSKSTSSSGASASATQAAAAAAEAAARKNRVGPVWKRRELIASDPKRHE